MRHVRCRQRNHGHIGIASTLMNREITLINSAVGFKFNKKEGSGQVSGYGKVWL